MTTTTTLNPILVTSRLLGAEHVVMVGAASILLFSSGSITLAVAVYNLYEAGPWSRWRRWPASRC